MHFHLWLPGSFCIKRLTSFRVSLNTGQDYWEFKQYVEHHPYKSTEPPLYLFRVKIECTKPN